MNCDGVVDQLSLDIAECQNNGPDLPPNPGCCGAEPTAGARVTSLASTANNVLFGGDGVSPILNRYDPVTLTATVFPQVAPLGSLAGFPFATFGDWDNDRDVDLVDWGFFQRCFTGGGLGPFAPGCEVFDFNGDQRIDLDDFAEFHDAVTGVGP